MDERMRGFRVVIVVALAVAISWFSTGMAANQTGGGATPAASPITSSAASPVAAKTSRQTPLALGKSAVIGDYTVRVKSVNLDAAQAVAKANPYNATPTAANVFVLVEIEVTYTGSGTGNPAFDLSFKSVGAKNRGYDDLNSSCGSVPHSAFEAGELFEGGTVSFNQCWQVSADEAPTLVMYAEPLVALDKNHRVWFALSGPNAAP